MKWRFISSLNQKIDREQMAEIIESWVNNPDTSLNTLGDRYSIHASHVSRVLKEWFYLMPSEETKTIAIPSAINEEMELKKTA